MISCGILGTTVVPVLEGVGRSVVEGFEPIRGVGRGWDGEKLIATSAKRGTAPSFLLHPPIHNRFESPNDNTHPLTRAEAVVIHRVPQ